VPQRQVPPLGLPPSGPVANCPTTTPIVRPSHPRTVKLSTPSLLVGASSATWHHTISTTVTRCVTVSYAAVVEYEPERGQDAPVVSRRAAGVLVLSLRAAYSPRPRPWSRGRRKAWRTGGRQMAAIMTMTMRAGWTGYRGRGSHVMGHPFRRQRLPFKLLR
jgi:hypothetical protein